MPGTGRRPGNPGTKEAILVAAREAFAERGYDQSSVREIASAAGVDPALVHHYFGTKDRLFLAVLEAPVDPAEMLPQIVEGPVGELPERLVGTFLSIWDDPVSGGAAVALLRSAFQREPAARLLRDFLTTQLMPAALSRLDMGAAEVRLRFELVAGQLVGVAVMRYVLRLEPLASAPPPVVVAALAPTVRRYLFEPLN
jgi:AcrR family transcriptional regulator